MRLQYAFKNMNGHPKILEHFEERLEQKIGKYTDEISLVELVIDKNKHDFRLSCSISSEHGFSTHTNITAKDVWAGIDQLLHKIGVQASKRKTLLKDHQNHYRQRHNDSRQFFIPEDNAIDAEDIMKYEETASKLRKAS